MKKRELTPEEIARRFEEINSREPYELTEEEAASLAAAEAENDGTTISLEEFRALYDYSGRLMLRIPKELHKSLAEAAKANGVSLNQYAAYKLARG